jgi:hypothetical protein
MQHGAGLQVNRGGPGVDRPGTVGMHMPTLRASRRAIGEVDRLELCRPSRRSTGTQQTQQRGNFGRGRTEL